MVKASAARRILGPGRARSLRIGLNLLPGMAIGLYGGSFNPAHSGHAHVARTALVRLGLDRVIWLVSPQNPLKPSAGTADLDRRLAGAAHLTHDPRMVVADLERRIGTRYTIDTVRWLKARFPSVSFVWIMGADSLASFHRWRGWVDLVREVPIAVISRPGHTMSSRNSPMARRFAGFRQPASAARGLARRPPPAWIYLEAPFHPVSSTALRESRLTNSPFRGKPKVETTPPGASPDP